MSKGTKVQPPQWDAYSVEVGECLNADLSDLHHVALRTVLVVEDDVELNKALCMRLERVGLNAIPAHDGIGAFSLYSKHDPDLILLDLGLPRMHGFKFIHHVRMSDEGVECPIVVLTGDPGAELEQRAERAGVARFFRKPISQRAVVQAVVELMQLE